MPISLLASKRFVRLYNNIKKLDFYYMTTSRLKCKDIKIPSLIVIALVKNSAENSSFSGFAFILYIDHTISILITRIHSRKHQYLFIITFRQITSSHIGKLLSNDVVILIVTLCLSNYQI